MTLSRTTFSIMTLNAYANCHYAVLTIKSIMLNVIMLNVVVLNLFVPVRVQ
jgi:hypothetical protein